MPADVITSLHRLRCAVAADEVLRRLEVLKEVCAKYDPNQPRVPAGNPDGGQWTSTGSRSGGDAGHDDGRILSDASLDNAWKPGAQYAQIGSDPPGRGSRMPRRGHHFVPRQVFRGLPIPIEARRVFDSARTGRLHGDRHMWSAEHGRYNAAVADHVREFMSKNSIQPENMTAGQAKELVQSIKESKDPRISGFNKRIYMREILQWFRRMPRRPE